MNDIQTLYFINITVSMTVAICLFLAAYGRDRELMTWSLPFAIHALVHLLLLGRGQIPDFLSITVANTLVTVMMSLFTQGVFRFEHLPSARFLIWWPVLPVFIIFLVYLDNFNVRVIVHAVSLVYQTGLLVLGIVWGFKNNDGRGKWIVVVASVLSALIMLFRAGFSLSSENISLTVSDSNLVQFISFTCIIITIVMLAFGFLLMSKEHAEGETLKLVVRDPLTQLGNRRMLDNALNATLQQQAEKKQYAALLLMDLDNFKSINDVYGHGIGDQFLIEVAYRIREHTKAADTVVRLGGDEFVVLIGHLEGDYAAAKQKVAGIAQRILDEVARPFQMLPAPLKQEGVTPASCTFSIGVTVFCDSMAKPQQLLRSADKAMYEAKRQGRNRVIFDEEESASPDSFQVA